ncbi:MAG: nucleotide exchange factor GrpE [Planctomycetes bacterium]|nr:nucleotide exchange factor GrpE [Planctomycetota bacterium]
MAFGKNKQTETTTEPEDPEVEAQEVPTAEVVEEEDPLLTLTRERDEAVDRWMRLQADFQNHRRHAQANIEAAVASARSEVLGEAVTILDYLDMALAFEVSSEEAKNLKVGVEMTRQQLQGLLDRMNVKAISAEGAFDPSRHQAVSTVETDEHEPGTIMEVVRGGWTMGEAVLRFAQVRVAAAPDTKDGDEDASEESVAVDGDPAPAADTDASHDEGASDSTEEETT